MWRGFKQALVGITPRRSDGRRSDAEIIVIILPRELEQKQNWDDSVDLTSGTRGLRLEKLLIRSLELLG